MKNLITIVQIIIGIALSALILLQAKGVGLGRTLGPATYHSKRGVENLIFKVTVALAVLFVGISLANQFIL